MSNPFTRSLSRGVEDESLNTFIGYWDRLETLVIAIYKNNTAGPDDDQEFERVWNWLNRHYAGWQRAMRPYWSKSEAGEGREREDPFSRLLATPSAAHVVGNWTLMQTLPEAREALNLFVLDQKGK